MEPLQITGCTQCEQVINHIKKHGGITSLDAFQNYAISRLSARILNLKEQGYSIDSTRVKQNGKTYSRYFFKTKVANNAAH